VPYSAVAFSIVARRALATLASKGCQAVRLREITISKAMDQTRATIIGLDPETGYSAEEARELAALFAGMRRLLEG